MEASADLGNSSFILQTIGILLFVIFLILMVFWLVRRLGFSGFVKGSNENRQVIIRGRIPVGPKHALVVAEILSKVYVLGVGDQSVQTVAGPFSREEWEKEKAIGIQQNKNGFLDIFQKALRRGK